MKLYFSNLIKKITLFSIYLFLISSVSAEVYQWRDAQGKLHFSDTPPLNSKATTVDIETVNIEKSVKKTGGVSFANKNTINNYTNNKHNKSIDNKQKTKSEKASLIAKKFTHCNRKGVDICYQPKDEIICKLRYGKSCDAIHFWKSNIKNYLELNNGNTNPSVFDYLSKRPLSIIESHIDKQIPTHKNTSKKDLQCLKHNGFYCNELSDHATCYKLFDLNCHKLRSWKDDIIASCKSSHGTDCESVDYAIYFRPVSFEEYNRNPRVMGAYDSFAEKFDFMKDRPEKYKTWQQLLNRLDGQ